MAKTDDAPANRRPHLIYWIVSFGLAGVLLYYSLQGIEWRRVWDIVRFARLPIVGVVLATLSLALFVRALRWRVLLSAEGVVPIPLAFWATSAGYFGNNVLPARAGELVRTLMVSRRAGLSKAFVLTTALSERIVDAIVLISISSLVLLTLPTKPGWLAHAAKPFAVIGVLGVSAIALLPGFESFWFKVLERLPVPFRLRHRVEEILRQVLRGIRSFHDLGRLGRFLSLTAVIWCLDGITTVVGASAIGVSIGLPVAFLLLAGLGLGSALPSTPGFVGIYQFVAVSILTPFGFSQNDAIAYILLFQGLNYIVVLSWGFLGIAKERKARTEGVTSQ